MKIAFCTPFKSMDHPRISGDVTIARDVVSALRGAGHDVVALPFFTSKQIYLQPEKWLPAHQAMGKMVEAAQGVNCWLTYGSYYKVPDIFGPTGSRRLGVPYFLFQASYAVNRAKRLKTWPGYMLNRRAMLSADHVFCNRVNDMRGCAKLLPQERYSYVKPGIPESLLRRDVEAGERLRVQWQTAYSQVVVTTAMMRPGVKAEGVRWVVESCRQLRAKGVDLSLVVAGDGPERAALEAYAVEQLGDRVRFLGLVDRSELAGLFSAGDLFAFPGLEESVGMVYLEAQMCGLPVVATDDEGAPHVVADGVSGLITLADKAAFTDGMERVLTDGPLREQLARQAADYVETNHVSSRCYREMIQKMEAVGTARSQA